MVRMAMMKLPRPIKRQQVTPVSYKASRPLIVWTKLCPLGQLPIREHQDTGEEITCEAPVLELAEHMGVRRWLVTNLK